MPARKYTDDPYFIEVANRVVRGLIAGHKPEKAWIIQIDNWFDHKRKTVSGKCLNRK
jgi:hypothetical protein